MPDTFTPDQFSRIQPVPTANGAMPCAKGLPKAKRVTGTELAAQKPMSFVDSVTMAMEPLFDASWSVRKEVSTADMIDALRPIMGEFTVADAAFVCAALDNIANFGCVQGAKRSAAEFVAFLLEDFICSAAATSPQDAAARSAYVNFGERYLGDADRLLMMHSLAWDVRAIQYNNFTEGQLFGGKDASDENDFKEEPWWISRERRLKEAGLQP